MCVTLKVIFLRNLLYIGNYNGSIIEALLLALCDLSQYYIVSLLCMDILWNVQHIKMELLYSGIIVCFLLTINHNIECFLNIKWHNICRPYNQKRIHTVIGSRGIVFAKNDIVNYSTLNDSFYFKQCSLHIISCPSCMINLRFKDLDLICTNSTNDGEFICNSMCIIEPPYLIQSIKCINSTANNSFIYYKSLTSQVNLNFSYRHSFRHAFTVEYLITRNTQLIEKKPEFNCANISFGGYVSTPFFPVSYADDLTFEQVINCKESMCLIYLIFMDFQISEESIVEFYDSDRKRLGIAGGITFRPPVILSSGPVLYIKFFANAGSSIGYRAQYSFVKGNVKNSILKPNTNCGGFVENKGGAITMMNMVEDSESDMLFDCIWLFRISHKYYHYKLQNLYLKIITFKHLVESNLVIQEGHTSNGRLLQWRNGSNFVELSVSIDIGYYVRLTGTFNSSSRLEIAYAAFSESKMCNAANQFFCKNERCIPMRLQCDGFDHCGDNSDESTLCFEDHESNSEYMDKSWYAYKPNYYFPNNTLYSKRYQILVGCFIGFVVFFIIILLIIYRIATSYHFQSDFQNRLISISQLLLEGIQLEDHNSTLEIGRVQSNYFIDELPPEYEAPPDYEEAINICEDLKKKINNTKVDLVGVESNNNSYNMNINNSLLSSVNLNTECLCCSQGSYDILALDINNMNRCCLSKMYSLRSLLINNQH